MLGQVRPRDADGVSAIPDSINPFADVATTSNPRIDRTDAKAYCFWEKFAVRCIQSIRWLLENLTRTLKNSTKKARKRALCFQNQLRRAHKACTRKITWSGSHARRVRFRDLETHRQINQLRDQPSRSFGLARCWITVRAVQQMWPPLVAGRSSGVFACGWRQSEI